MNQYLDYLARLNKPYLHAKGEVATEHLINWLDCQPGEQVLEFGVGTGGTFVKVVSRYKQTKFWGVDVSDIMIKKASKRLIFCMLNGQATVKKISQNQLIDFADNYFDKIYIESVLGIQDGQALRELIAQFSRILKPSGTLIFNETIWLNSTDLAEAIQFNEVAKKEFGIFQANTDYPYLNDWKALLTKNHFYIVKAEQVDALSTTRVRAKFNERLSRLFTLFGSFYGKLFLAQSCKQFNTSFKLFSSEKQLMEGYLIMALNSKSSV